MFTVCSCVADSYWTVMCVTSIGTNKFESKQTQASHVWTINVQRATDFTSACTVIVILMPFIKIENGEMEYYFNFYSSMTNVYLAYYIDTKSCALSWCSNTSKDITTLSLFIIILGSTCPSHQKIPHKIIGECTTDIISYSWTSIFKSP